MMKKIPKSSTIVARLKSTILVGKGSAVPIFTSFSHQVYLIIPSLLLRFAGLTSETLPFCFRQDQSNN
jgi:hypothetical protein